MRKLINIWKIPWDSHWMQRAIHILSVLRKRPALHVIPKGREQGWHRDSGHAHQSSQLWEVQLRSQFAFSQLHLVFFVCLLFRTTKAREEGWTGPAVLVQVEHPEGSAGNCPPWNCGEEREDTLLTLTDNPTPGGGVEVLQGRAAPQGDSEEPGEAPQGHVQSVVPSQGSHSSSGGTALSQWWTLLQQVQLLLHQQHPHSSTNVTRRWLQGWGWILPDLSNPCRRNAKTNKGRAHFSTYSAFTSYTNYSPGWPFKVENPTELNPKNYNRVT